MKNVPKDDGNLNMPISCCSTSFPTHAQLTSCDSQTSHKVICYSPDCGLPLQRCPVCRNAAIDWDTNDQGDIEPVDMFVPIGSGDGLFGNVWLLWIVLFVSVWLRGLCHARRYLRRGHSECEGGRKGEFGPNKTKRMLISK